MKKLVLKLVLRFLKDASLSTEDRSLLTACILDKLVALPASAILKRDTDGTLIVGDKRVNAESALAIHKSAVKTLNERAWKIVFEQVRFKAVEVGIHQGMTPDQNLFSKAALWNLGELKKLFEELAGGAAPEDLDDDD